MIVTMLNDVVDEQWWLLRWQREGCTPTSFMLGRTITKKWMQRIQKKATSSSRAKQPLRQTSSSCQQGWCHWKVCSFSIVKLRRLHAPNSSNLQQSPLTSWHNVFNKNILIVLWRIHNRANTGKLKFLCKSRATKVPILVSTLHTVTMVHH